MVLRLHPGDARPILIESDGDGLRMAVVGLFEESLAKARIASLMRKADAATKARMLDDLPERELSPGYYARAAYLLDLSMQISLGIAPEPASVSHADLVGLGAVRDAKAEFEREHPCCPRCGERQDNRWMTQCFSCNCKLSGGSR